MFERQDSGGAVEGERKRSSIPWSTTQRLQRPELGLLKTRTVELHLGLSHGSQEPKNLDRCINREAKSDVELMVPGPALI